jgi:hypothetical protein
MLLFLCNSFHSPLALAPHKTQDRSPGGRCASSLAAILLIHPVCLQSTNGLCVNGYKVRSQQLQHGDILSFEVPQTVGFGQSVQPQWDERSHFRFRFCVEPIET